MRHLVSFILLCVCLLGQFVDCIDDPYKVLGVSKSASQDEIKKAYKHLAVKWHPDKNENSQESQDKYVEITTAYEILTDDDKRRQYEQSKYGHQNRGYDGFGFNYFFQNVKPIFSETFSLTYENYEILVGQSEDLWIIEFYTDRCGPCIEHAPIWEQTAKSLKDFVRFGRVNADEQGSLLRHFRVRSIPAIVAVLGNGNTHTFFGKFELNQLSDFIKKLMPSNIATLNNNQEWGKFQNTNDNKVKALLFSSHASSVSPLYKYVSVKYSHLFNFAQVTAGKLDQDLSNKFEVSTRPTIVFFTDNSANPRVVPGSFTKESIISILDENKYLGVPEFTNDNFLSLCGRKSTVLCGIAFTARKSKHFAKHSQFLKELASSDSGIKVGWVDAETIPHFPSFFKIVHQDGEKLNNMIIWNGSKKKYSLINEELTEQTLKDWFSKKEKAKFADIPQDVPSLHPMSAESMLDFSWLSSIFRFLMNNFMTVVIIGIVVMRVFVNNS